MTSASGPQQKYVLGLDLGSASLGWALIGLNESNYPESLIRTGVRIFAPGVDGTTLEIQEGKDKSKAVDRRTARLHRRQLRRRAYRQAKLFQSLQQRDLLLRCDSSTPASPSEERNQILTHKSRMGYNLPLHSRVQSHHAAELSNESKHASRCLVSFFVGPSDIVSFGGRFDSPRPTG